MRVLIYEPDHRGHHFVHLHHVLPDLCSLGVDVTLATTPSGAASTQFQIHLGEVASKITVDTSMGEKDRSGNLQKSLQALNRLRRLSRKLQPDHIYVPYGDGISQLAGIAEMAGMRIFPRRAESEVLLMRGGYQYPIEGRKRRWLNRIAPRVIDRGPWTRIHHLNPDDLAVLKRSARQPRRYRLMPEPVEPPPTVDKSEARRRLGVPEAGRYIGCAGGIDSRKGIHLLVRAFLASLTRLSPTDRLLLAGPVEDRVKAVLDNEASDAIRADRIIVINRPLTADEFGFALKAMDVVATPYPRHYHSAGIVVHAAACERPILGSAIGWMERTIHDFQLGATCNVTNPDELNSELIRAIETSAEFQHGEMAQRFLSFHNQENFRAHWLCRMRERLNLPPDRNLIAWESVVQGEQPEHCDALVHQ